uniref:Uncharacterized protein n=1 Tax=Rhizophora mucronata TaxID=61149 RepID=A0A2P2JJ98_RHIMU
MDELKQSEALNSSPTMRRTI